MLEFWYFPQATPECCIAVTGVCVFVVYICVYVYVYISVHPMHFLWLIGFGWGDLYGNHTPIQSPLTIIGRGRVVHSKQVSQWATPTDALSHAQNIVMVVCIDLQAEVASSADNRAPLEKILGVVCLGMRLFRGSIMQMLMQLYMCDGLDKTIAGREILTLTGV